MYLIYNSGNWIALKNKLGLAYQLITKDDLKFDDGVEELNLPVKQQKNYLKLNKK